MIRLDYRTGSWELARHFKQFGINPERSHLEFGDCDFTGNGPKGVCSIVIERKTINDLVQSMQSRRLSGHQLPGMAENYDVCYLIVEGLWRPGKDGQIEVCNGSWNDLWSRSVYYRSVDAYLATLELCAGVIFRRTANENETVWVIVDLYRWWNEKNWAEHKSHNVTYAPAEVKRKLGLISHRPTLVEKVAMQLPGLDSKARKVAEHFQTVREMANAEKDAWMEIKGIGKIGANKIVQSLTTKGL